MHRCRPRLGETLAGIAGRMHAPVGRPIR